MHELRARARLHAHVHERAQPAERHGYEKSSTGRRRSRQCNEQQGERRDRLAEDHGAHRARRDSSRSAGSSSTRTTGILDSAVILDHFRWHSTTLGEPGDGAAERGDGRPCLARDGGIVMTRSGLARRGPGVRPSGGNARRRRRRRHGAADVTTTPATATATRRHGGAADTGCIIFQDVAAAASSGNGRAPFPTTCADSVSAQQLHRLRLLADRHAEPRVAAVRLRSRGVQPADARR